MIPEETISEILEKTDIVDLISSYIPIKSAGTKSYKGLCPFHNEKTPSFTITPSQQIYYCFGCQASGNAIQFLMNYENLTFIEALEKLANKTNVELKEEGTNSSKYRKEKKLIEIHEKVSSLFHQFLFKNPKAKEARQYLKTRGYKEEEAKNWSIGWADSSIDIAVWGKENGYSLQELSEAGLISINQSSQKKPYFRWADRLIFPIKNTNEKIIAFSGRLLKEKANSGKYINSPETLIFKKSKQFFGLDKARRDIMKSGYALICEGQLDVIRCHQFGILNSIATLGTAFTSQHSNQLLRYTEKAIICFDSDSAGIKAGKSAFAELSEKGIHTHAIFLPEGQDPDSFLTEKSANDFLKKLENAPNYITALIRHQGLPQTPEEKSKYAHEIANMLANISEPIYRQAMIDQITALLELEPTEFLTLVNEKKRNLHSFQAQKTFQAQKKENSSSNLPPINDRIATLCYLAIHYENSREWQRKHYEIIEKYLSSIAGFEILKILLEKLPHSKQTPAKLNAFLETHFSSEQNQLIANFETKIMISEHMEASREALHKAVEDEIKEKIIQNNLKMKKKKNSRKNEDTEEILAIHKEILDLKESLLKISSLIPRVD